jgi:histidinol dehydrogenase
MDNIQTLVRQIIEDVKLNGDSALIKYTKQFDNIDITEKDFFISLDECKKSLEKIPKDVLEILKTSKENISKYHKAQFKNLKTVSIKNKGARIFEQIISIEKAGVYIPGGKFSYPSSVLMNIIPAKEAGVKEIIAVTPKKNLTDIVKASLYLAGADKIICLGGAQIIAGLAYGTKTIPKVDIIVGPGNMFVTEAKKQVFGDVGIDMLAGPSEVVVLSDDTTPINFIVKDLEAQAEHDINAKAFLISEEEIILNKVKNLVDLKYKDQIFYIRANGIQNCIEQINKIGPEHLEILGKKYKNILKNIKNAGAIFVGDYTSVPLGDYWLGPSHTLPTNSTARFSSGLNVTTFLRRRAIMSVDKSFIKKQGDKIIKFAELEGLINHADSIKIRK